MNPSNLSDKEVLRICIPESPLEKRLFEMCDSLADEASDLQSELNSLQQAYDDYAYELSDEASDEIRGAITLIKAGKSKEAIDKLEHIL